VLKQQKQIGNSVRPSFLDQFPLKYERLLVSDQAQPANFQLAPRRNDPGGHFARSPTK
jgi:hypothetical protein